ncbi:NTF2 fold immunity protein [Corynebacterium mustelae]|uniref:NTF2 fold immunity protein n=1 Tax=Corynebacterium mustelae TaxID=571915 RepID=A0A0G3H5B5_9CORY|nr:hypothetical protein [Corynebacterium mustelae]AKK06302.1 NTF2 fold immunity protein [Corynebacterium mustelae]
MLPDGVSPEEVVLSYILTKHYWETSAYQHQEEDPDVFEAELAKGEALSKAHLTERKQNDMCVSISSPPQFSLGYVLMRVTQVKPSRVEIYVKPPYPGALDDNKEWIFVCLKKNGQWRIDSGKSRMVGTWKYERDYLV